MTTKQRMLAGKLYIPEEKSWAANLCGDGT